MAVVVLVVVVGLIVGVAIELLLSKRHRARKAEPQMVDPNTVSPAPPRLPEPRFVDDGEGFRIIGPVEYDGPEAAPWESDEPNGPEDGP